MYWSYVRPLELLRALRQGMRIHKKLGHCAKTKNQDQEWMHFNQLWGKNSGRCWIYIVPWPDSWISKRFVRASTMVQGRAKVKRRKVQVSEWTRISSRIRVFFQLIVISLEVGFLGSVCQIRDLLVLPGCSASVMPVFIEFQYQSQGCTHYNPEDHSTCAGSYRVRPLLCLGNQFHRSPCRMLGLARPAWSPWRSMLLSTFRASRLQE